MAAKGVLEPATEEWIIIEPEARHGGTSWYHLSIPTVGNPLGMIEIWINIQCGAPNDS